MALADDILTIRYAIGDSPSTPFYPILPDEAYEGFLNRTNNDINQAIKFAALSLSWTVSSWNSREQVGDLSVTNDFARNYLRVLQTFLSSPGLVVIPQGLFPWSASVDSDNKLLDIQFCGDTCGSTSVKKGCC